MAILSLAPAICAQEVRLYSEFQRIDPFGQVVRPDRAGSSREILSPAVVRNGFASFHLVVSVPPGTKYALHIAQNPDDAVKPALYRERHQRLSETWIPDALVPIELPFEGALGADIPGRKVDVFWLDLWVGPNAPAERVRVEAQINIGERWIIYPMEVRILPAVVPAGMVRKLQAASGALPPVAAPADASANLALQQYLCGKTESTRRLDLPTLRSHILRNALQDIALARHREALFSATEVHAALLAALKAPDAKSWCADPSRFRPFGPESWLRLRQALWSL
jgi:hypothetical protein